MKSSAPVSVLPVSIMAHNEEKVIERAIENCFEQVCPEGFSVLVVVVANGCTDRTEEVVSIKYRDETQGAA